MFSWALTREMQAPSRPPLRIRTGSDKERVALGFSQGVASSRGLLVRCVSCAGATKVFYGVSRAQQHLGFTRSQGPVFTDSWPLSVETTGHCSGSHLLATHCVMLSA